VRMSVCNTKTFEILDLERLFLAAGIGLHLRKVQVEFIYQSHWVNLKVTVVHKSQKRGWLALY